MGSTYNFVWISLGKRCAAMDLRQLKYFLAIVDAGSFSKASQKLFVAQPSLSQQIANLEFELKTKLLSRRRRPAASSIGTPVKFCGKWIRSARTYGRTAAAKPAR
jgi:hypothetical protein